MSGSGSRRHELRAHPRIAAWFGVARFLRAVEQVLEDGQPRVTRKTIRWREGIPGRHAETIEDIGRLRYG